MSTPFFNLFFGQIRSHNKRVLRTRHKVSGPQTLGVLLMVNSRIAVRGRDWANWNLPQLIVKLIEKVLCLLRRQVKALSIVVDAD